MSGNLKILVHKSWHVWKRENREKVARDERNFKEENERKDERERNLLQEKNLEELISAQEHLPQGSSDIEVPFRLFGDIEELDKKNKELKELNQARKDKEFNDKKKAGEAPWALGEGAAEKIGSVVPYWYAKPSTNASSATTSSSSSRTLPFNSEWGGRECEEDAILKREELRKVAQDPMIGILKPSNKTQDDMISTKADIRSDQPNLVRVKIEGESAISRLSNSTCKSQNEFYFNSEVKDKEKKSKHKHSRKSENLDDMKRKKRKKCTSSDSDSDLNRDTDTGKRVKKERHSACREGKDNSSRSSAEYDRNSSSNNINHSESIISSSSNSSSSSGRTSADRPNSTRTTSKSHTASKSITSSAPHSSSTSSSNFSSTISTSALRQRRMEREYAERKRATVLLARADIFGPLNAQGVGNLPDGREQRYNQQFHPHIAR